MFDCFLIHYGELGLKGLNRPLFEKKLIVNIEKVLEGTAHEKTRRIQGRIILKLNEKSDANAIEERLKKVFGVAWFAPCFTAEAAMESVKKTVGNQLQLAPNTKLRVSAKRADKALPFTSMDVNRQLGAYLVENFEAKISLEQPEKDIGVELVDGKAYIFDEKFKGLYGLPVGVSGKVLHLLSGGIDSPVAAWLLMKRGCEVDFLHFHAYKKYDEKKNEKILKLAQILSQYCFKARVFFTPFQPFQAEAVDSPAKYRLILFRRFMMRVAEQIANKQGITALASGENLAQVSSQTLENMAAISRTTSMPILRPLLTYEKNETVDLAKQIGTFEVSTQPYQDCCNLFITKHPVTKARLEVVESVERKLNLEDAIKECLDNTETIGVK